MDKELFNLVQQEFDRLKKSYGIGDAELKQEDIENILGISVDELEKEYASNSHKHTLEVESIHPDSVMPKYAFESDSGFDLCSVEEITIPPMGRALIPTGLKFGIPEATEIQIRPKSGLAINQGLTILNTPGTVDSGYNGEIKVIVFNSSSNTCTIKKGMKVAQAVLCPVFSGKFVTLEKVDKIGEKDRGENGFGSTGLNI
jgi:dUTP pyrophosphatase